MLPALLLLFTVWRTDALQEVHLSGHDPSHVSNFRLVVPLALQDDELPYSSVTLHDRHVFTYDRDTEHGRLLPTRDTNTRDRDIAHYYRDRINHYRDVSAHEFDTRNVSKHDRDVKLHDRDHRWIKINLHDRSNKLLEHNAKLDDQDNRWIKINMYSFKDRHPALHDSHKKNIQINDHGVRLVDGDQNVELLDHTGESHDRADQEDIVVEDDAPRFRVYSAGERGVTDGAFSEIPSSEFTRDVTEHRPSVKKDLSAGGLWLESVCQSMKLDQQNSTPVISDSLVPHPHPRPLCGVCCALHRQLAELARHSGPQLVEYANPAREVAPEGVFVNLPPDKVLAKLAPPDPESVPEELVTLLEQVLAERRDWHVLNSEHPDRMKQYVLIHKDGTLVV